MTMRASVLGTALLLATGVAAAKLPPPTEADKAKAAEAAARTAWQNAVASYQLCKAMDRVVAHYRSSVAAGKVQPRPQGQAAAGQAGAGAVTVGTSATAATAAVATCKDPGPFAYTPTRTIEEAGAHSPPATSKAPPTTTTATDAEAKPKAKP